MKFSKDDKAIAAALESLNDLYKAIKKGADGFDCSNFYVTEEDEINFYLSRDDYCFLGGPVGKKIADVVAAAIGTTAKELAEDYRLGKKHIRKFRLSDSWETWRPAVEKAFTEMRDELKTQLKNGEVSDFYCNSTYFEDQVI